MRAPKLEALYLGPWFSVPSGSRNRSLKTGTLNPQTLKRQLSDAFQEPSSIQFYFGQVDALPFTVQAEFQGLYGFAIPIIVIIVIIVGTEHYSNNRHDSSNNKCRNARFPCHSLDLGFVSLRFEPSALTPWGDSVDVSVAGVL